MRFWAIFQLRTSCKLDEYVFFFYFKPHSRFLTNPQVCRRLRQATYQRTVWVNIYERSNFLLQKGPLSAQSSLELECSLVRAAKINKNWTSSEPAVYTRRRFPRQLPTYNFDSNIICGRFLQLAESTGISWYDLDADDMATPVLTYPCLSVIPVDGYLHHQVNANGEGSNAVWVSFISRTPHTMYVQFRFQSFMSSLSRF